ncbi:MAG: hypothetical protein WC516_03090 [Patescibacteria group bacterium]
MRKPTLTLLALLFIAFGLLFSNVYLAQAQTGNDSLLGRGGGTLSACLADGSKCQICDFIQVFVNAADMMAAFSGTLALIMFVMGGIIMITAMGNETRITWGKNTLIAAVIGIFIIFIAWTLVNSIMAGFYGADKSDWNVCSTSK